MNVILASMNHAHPIPESGRFISPFSPYTRVRREVNLKIGCKDSKLLRDSQRFCQFYTKLTNQTLQQKPQNRYDQGRQQIQCLAVFQVQQGQPTARNKQPTNNQ